MYQKTVSVLGGVLIIVVYLFYLSYNSKENFSEVLFKSKTNLQILVACQEDAEPYLNYKERFAFSISNKYLSELLSTNHITISGPNSESEIYALPHLEDIYFSKKEILALAKPFSIKKKKNNRLIVLFLNGFLKSNQKVHKSILGINLDNTNVIAMFKPVIENSSPNFKVRTLNEQMTLIHEIGHAIGLVNNGLSPINNHVSRASKDHCSDSLCIMYKEFLATEGLKENEDYNLKSFCSDCQLDISY